MQILVENCSVVQSCECMRVSVCESLMTLMKSSGEEWEHERNKQFFYLPIKVAKRRVLNVIKMRDVSVSREQKILLLKRSIKITFMIVLRLRTSFWDANELKLKSHWANRQQKVQSVVWGGVQTVSVCTFIFSAT